MIGDPRTRRRLLAQTLAALGLAAVPSWSAAFGRLGTEPTAAALAERMTSLLSPRASAAAVGRAYLASLPQERRDAGYLESEVCRRCGADALADLADEDLHARLRAWISDDFRSGSVVTVEGWILSQTEAALAGLAATLEPSGAGAGPA